MDDLEKIGVSAIRPFKKNGHWFFQKDQKGKSYSLAPAGMTEFVLDPLILGVDKLIEISVEKKGIDSQFLLLFSTTYFPNADVKLILREPKFDGWTYDIEELNFKGVMPGQRAWICPYMNMYFPEPPKELYLKVENENS